MVNILCGMKLKTEEVPEVIIHIPNLVLISLLAVNECFSQTSWCLISFGDFLYSNASFLCKSLFLPTCISFSPH